MEKCSNFCDSPLTFCLANGQFIKGRIYWLKYLENLVIYFGGIYKLVRRNTNNFFIYIFIMVYDHISGQMHSHLWYVYTLASWPWHMHLKVFTWDKCNEMKYNPDIVFWYLYTSILAMTCAIKIIHFILTKHII